jgi:membrane associated rhomboid family serine protease
MIAARIVLAPLIPLKDNLPAARFPLLTVLLIAVNLAVFGWQLGFQVDGSLERAGVEAGIDQSAIEYGAIPFRITHPGDDACAIAGDQLVCGEPAASPLDQAPWWLTLLTAMFMAGSLLQLAINSLFLWLFGKSVEDSLGRPRFLALYLLSGLAGTYLQAVFDSGSTAPLIGATAAVGGLMGAYAVLHPRAAILCFVMIPFWFTFVEVPALILVAARFVLQLVPSIGETSISGIATDSGLAYLSLIGGFAFGAAASRPLLGKRRGPPGAAAQAVS